MYVYVLKGAPGIKKNFFSALWASVSSKNKGGGGGSQAPPLYSLTTD